MIKTSPINTQINTLNLPFKQRIPKTSLPIILKSIVIWKDIQLTISQSIAHPYTVFQYISSISQYDVFGMMMFIQTMKRVTFKTFK